MNNRILVPWLALSLAALACVAPAKRLDEYLKAGRYAEARALLEEEKVGIAPAPTAPPEAVELRTRYTEELESVVKKSVDALLAAGSAHGAQAKAQEFRELCPWSQPIDKLLSGCNDKIARINAVEDQWRNLLGNGVARPVDARRFLAEIHAERPWILDSERMRAFEAAAAMAIVHDWAAALAKEPVRKGRSAEEVCADLSKAGIDPVDIEELRRALRIRAALPGVHETGARLSPLQLKALSEARKVLGLDGAYESDSRIGPCTHAVWKSLEKWQAEVHSAILSSEQVTYAELAESEAWMAVETHGSLLRSACARAHANFAGRRAPQGVASALSLLHAIRASTLGIPVEDSALVSARALAEATWDATPPPLLRLDIDLLPKVDPEIRGLLLLVLTGELTESPGAWSRLDPYSLDEKAPRIVLSVRNAEHVADFSDVRKVDSNYFSHFETVANPQKAYLESLTDSARRDADFKEISYNSAVSSHNIWRNQYSLNNVNWAYSAYSAAVDRYNSLVIQYNATPSTISRPVYLPYSFEQGRVRFGWTLDTEIKIGAVGTVDAVKESVVSDFVRLGNKATDQSEAYRAFDGFDIEVDANAGLGHLLKTVALVKEAMNTDMAALTVAPIADLTPQESSILGWLYHPWGRQAALASVLDLPEWVVASATSLALKRDPPAPPARRLEAAPDAVSGPLNPESGAAALAMFVCQTSSTGVDGIATGTATLIGPEGLMLTCAHVLRGHELSLEYPTGPWKGTYEGELVFVNSERDVALVRAKGLANDQWASVRLDAPVAAGEAIVAIGNPAMDVGGVNLGGVSRGIVSSPSVERGKDRYLTADISIASGSSGGPLFSLKDGCLVGVVQAVATAPGFPRTENQVAATGFLCLAAGAQSLREWLGLESGTR